MYGLKDKNGNAADLHARPRLLRLVRHPRLSRLRLGRPGHEKTWTGVPLFLCIGKVDGGKGHGGYGAYNEALALKGYRIKLASATGKSRDHRLADHPQPTTRSSWPTSSGLRADDRLLPAAARRPEDRQQELSIGQISQDPAAAEVSGAVAQQERRVVSDDGGAAWSTAPAGACAAAGLARPGAAGALAVVGLVALPPPAAAPATQATRPRRRPAPPAPSSSPSSGEQGRSSSR